MLAFDQLSNSSVTSHVAIKYNFSINLKGFIYESHILTDIQQNCAFQIDCGCSTWSSTKPFRLRSPVSNVALKAVSEFTRNKLLQGLKVGFFWVVFMLSFQEQELSARTQALQAASASCSFRPNGFDDNDPPGSCGPTGGGGGGGFSTVGRLVFWLWRQPGIHWFQSSSVLLRTTKILNFVRYCIKFWDLILVQKQMLGVFWLCFIWNK